MGVKCLVLTPCGRGGVRACGGPVGGLRVLDLFGVAGRRECGSVGESSASGVGGAVATSVLAGNVE